MKKLLASITFMLLLTAGVFAQEKQAEQKKEKHEKFSQRKAINLTEEQKVKMKVVREEHKVKIDALKNSNLSQEELKEQRMALHKTHRKAMNEILTPEQRDQVKASMAAKHQHKNKHTRKRQDKFKDMNLSEGQRTAMKELRNDTRKQIEVLKNNKSLNENERREQFASIRKENRKKMMDLLTAEQKAELKKNPRPKKTVK